MADADVDRLVLADALLDDLHLPLLQLADDPVIGVLLRDAADQLLAEPRSSALEMSAALQAELQGTARVAAEDGPDAVALDDHLLAGAPVPARISLSSTSISARSSASWIWRPAGRPVLGDGEAHRPDRRRDRRRQGGQPATTRGVTTRTVLIGGLLRLRDDRRSRSCRQMSDLDLATCLDRLGDDRTERPDAGRARPCAQVRRRFSSSLIVFDSGTVSAKLGAEDLGVEVGPRLKASNRPEMIASSISAPLKPSPSPGQAIEVELRRVAPPLRQVDAEDLAPLVARSAGRRRRSRRRGPCGASRAAGG